MTDHDPDANVHTPNPTQSDISAVERMMSGNGGNAFPMMVSFLQREHSSEKARFTYDVKTEGGMTLRDYFAGQALVSIACSATNPEYINARARSAYAWADAMIKAREV